MVTGVVSAGPTVDYPVVYFGSTQTAKGTVVVNTDGTFTYTPTTAAREAAAAADAAETGANQDSFTVTINYGVPEDVGGVATSLLVTVPISPSSPAPQPGLDPSYTLSAPDDTGVVTGVVSAGPTVDYPVVYFGSTRSRQGHGGGQHRRHLHLHTHHRRTRSRRSR